MEIEYVVKEYFLVTYCEFHDSLSIIWDCYCDDRYEVKVTVSKIDLNVD